MQAQVVLHMMAQVARHTADPEALATLVLVVQDTVVPAVHRTMVLEVRPIAAQVGLLMMDLVVRHTLVQAALATTAPGAHVMQALAEMGRIVLLFADDSYRLEPNLKTFIKSDITLPPAALIDCAVAFAVPRAQGLAVRMEV